VTITGQWPRSTSTDCAVSASAGDAATAENATDRESSVKIKRKIHLESTILLAPLALGFEWRTL
jgi:hypothetical protein